jgi:hypothetical protein
MPTHSSDDVGPRTDFICSGHTTSMRVMAIKTRETERMRQSIHNYFPSEEN